jgi:hypothetical protein
VFAFDLEGDYTATYAIQQSTNLLEWNTIHHSFGASTTRTISRAWPTQETSQAFFRARPTNTPYAILAQSSIVLRGGIVDSFDSTDTNYSTGGLYDPSKRRDKAFVAASTRHKRTSACTLQMPSAPSPALHSPPQTQTFTSTKR